MNLSELNIAKEFTEQKIVLLTKCSHLLRKDDETIESFKTSGREDELVKHFENVNDWKKRLERILNKIEEEVSKL